MKGGIFAGPTALGDDAPACPTLDPIAAPCPRMYSPGFRPWIAFQGMGADASQVPAAASSVTGAVQTASSAILPALVVGGVALAAVGVLLYSLMGYYVGKKLGTKWGWFWGMGGPVGIAAMTGYRQYKGRVATPNRRSRKRSKGRPHRVCRAFQIAYPGAPLSKAALRKIERLVNPKCDRPVSIKRASMARRAG